MNGWMFILLSASTSLMIAHFLKISENKGLNTVRVLTVNYFIASVSAFVYSDVTQLNEIGSELLPVMLLAFLTGVIFILNFFVYSKSVFLNGIGISIAMMRVSLIVPVLLSIAVYGEILSLKQLAGVLLVFFILYLLLPNKKAIFSGPVKGGGYLLLLFIGTGIGDASLKVFEVEFLSVIPKELFMGFVFLTALLCGILTIVIQGNWKFTKEELLTGTMIGIPNLLTSVFLISALQLMNGAIVFSSVNLITVAGGTILGVLYWKDRFLSSQWLGIFLALAAILLLV